MELVFGFLYFSFTMNIAYLGMMVRKFALEPFLHQKKGAIQGIAHYMIILKLPLLDAFCMDELVKVWYVKAFC